MAGGEAIGDDIDEMSESICGEIWEDNVGGGAARDRRQEMTKEWAGKT